MTNHLLLSLLVCLASSTALFADELRIIDARGLSRAIRIVKGEATVAVSSVTSGTTCVLANADGVVAERNVTASTEGVCLFSGVAAGTWKVTVTGADQFKVRIDQ